MAASTGILFAVPGLALAGAAEVAKPAMTVVMYTTQTCGYCVKARAWFASNNVAWEERDIESSADAKAQWKSYGGMGTPLILINGKQFNGFSPDLLEAELAKHL
jgi:glutaredoxin